MANQKTTELTADATPTGDDLVMVVDDVAGTPTNKKVTLTNLAASAPFSDAYQAKDADLTTIAAADNGSVLAATTASFTTADETKLDGIETAADVTDATNVSAAGAAMISSGAGAPGSTPAKVGNIYIDTTGDRVYVATDTASSADWDLLPVTGAQVLALLSPVAGSGSGLDADLLDGNEASAFQTADAELSALAGLTSAADKLPYFTGSGTAALADFTAAGRALMDDANAAAQLTTLGAAPTASPTFTGTVTLPTGLTGVLRADTGVVSTDSDVTDLVSAATTSLAGKSELATSAETTTGSDTSRTITPDGLRGSEYGQRVVTIACTDPNGAVLAVADGQGWYRVPAVMNGWNLVAVGAHVTTVSTSGTPTIQIHNVTDAVDMLSTRITIDANEKDSATAAAAAVIDTAKDDVATGDELRIDVDVAGTGTKGLIVSLTFGKP